jgi:hypothetical protein
VRIIASAPARFAPKGEDYIDGYSFDSEGNG